MPRPLRRGLVRLAFVAALGAVHLLGRGPETATGEEATGRLAFRLVERGAQAGIAFRHEAPRLDPRLDNIAAHVAGLGAAVSVADADADGRPDLYLVTSRLGRQNALYVNVGGGRFEERAAQAGLADVNEEGTGVSMGSVWGDVDNDGLEDVFVYKWGRSRLFRNLGDLRFEDVTERAGLGAWANANGAVFFDFDRDGLLDLYVAHYFREEVDFWNLQTTRIMQDSFEYSRNGGKNRLYRNEGDLVFRDVTDEMGVGSTRWTLAAAAADLDGDGWPDLYLANDYGPEEVYRNLQGQRFESMTWAGLEDDSKSGMSVAMGDVLSRGRLDVYVTNISEPGYLFQGNNLRMNHLAERSRFQDRARGALADCGWAWGSQFGDLDNDGRADLVVLNGFISADPKRDYWYAMSKIAGAHRGVFEDARNWPALDGASLSGYERSRLLLNRGDLDFMDVAEAVGLVDRHDGRAVAFLDVEDDGSLDLVVANQNGPALLYGNRVEPDRGWLLVALEGTRSNHSAIGAQVTVTAGGRKRMQVVDGGMGFASQNDRRLHFGLGTASRAERVEILWPSGTRQVLEDVAGRQVLRIREPRDP